MDEIDDYKKKTYNIYPYIMKSSNFLKYNSFQFYWSTPIGKIFKVLINLPIINFTIPSNSIKIQQFLDYKLLFFIMEKNFENWDFYIVNYLASFKRFRILLENLARLCFFDCILEIFDIVDIFLLIIDLFRVFDSGTGSVLKI
jgi:hypothetical protein